jgi:hypothetical protein
MDELITPLGRIKLNNPVDVRDVDASGGKVGCQQQ